MNELLLKAGNQGISEEETAELSSIFEKKIPGLDSLLGLKYVAFAPQVVLELEVTRDHVQPWGITNGGTYASLGESAGSFAWFIASGGNAVMGTTNTTNFLRPSKPGDVIRSTVHEVHAGRTSQLWRIDHVNAASGKLLATTDLRTVVVPLDQVTGAR
ncbi:MAG TPA: PaaI family thioesterase [Candidatus Corynebacterium avicola]|uniref:PaaI family thioesterase n=1 Tax=Candidatus Corynebacterium avicola TaxID=2838527 RepID=A0A9D1ULH2_9CORY|nr:PaaI family thioesterase [Candidatus Corynebacterium avicola]